MTHTNFFRIPLAVVGTVILVATADSALARRDVDEDVCPPDIRCVYGEVHPDRHDDRSPGDDTSVDDDSSPDDTSGDDTSSDDTSSDDTSGDDTSGDDTSGDDDSTSDDTDSDDTAGVP